MTLAVRTMGLGTTFLSHQLLSYTLSKPTAIKKAAFSTSLHFGLPYLKSSSQFSRINISRITHQRNIQLRSFSYQRDEPECVLTLYHKDKRIKNSIEYIQVSFSEQTAKKANDIVTSYFDVSQEWDKKLLKSIFLDDIDLNWFEFIKKDNPNMILGVKISGNRCTAFNKNPEEFYTPIERPIKLSVKVDSIFGRRCYELDYEKIRQKTTKDFFAVALFNSNSFKSVTTYSTNIGFIRTLEKLD